MTRASPTAPVPGEADSTRCTPSRTSPEANHEGSGRLDGRTAIVTGGDSGIGRSVAVLFAREGADVAVVYLEEHDDAEDIARPVENEAAAACCWPPVLARLDRPGVPAVARRRCPS